MQGITSASLAEFERLADLLLDLAKKEYRSSTQLSPKLVLMGKPPASDEQTTEYRFSLVPVAELMANTGAIPQHLVVAALMEKMVNDPDVLAVGLVSEAWCTAFTWEERENQGSQVDPVSADNRKEALLLTLRSVDCFAIKACPLQRQGKQTTIGEGELWFQPRAHEPRLNSLVH